MTSMRVESKSSTFVIDAAESVVLIEARSTVGPIELATTEISGTAAIAITAGRIDVGDHPVAELELQVESLASGNLLYDAEVHRRLDARRYPTIRAELCAARVLEADRWVIEGELTIHGTTKELSGSAAVELLDDDRLRIYGEQAIDIRDFGISLPSTLMLRIYPDVMVRFRLQAVRKD
jgi:polyisoprenoid-binding protein YceI